MGRDDLLKRLHNQLQSNERIGITGVRGMGGIGKTELALQYAIASYNQQTYPAGVCWLQARDQEIATQIVSFARANLGIKPPDDMEAQEQVRFTWQRWPEGDSLIILDDVTDYDAIAPYLPPPSEKFKILITTRVNLGSTVTQIEIEELTDEAAIALLKSLVGDDRIESQIADARKLCKRVGNLPLGLELLGRFLANNEDSLISELLTNLASYSLEAEALTAPESGMTAKRGIAEALELSWNQLSPEAKDLACLLGMFALAPIPWSLVEQCVTELSKPQSLSLFKKILSLFHRRANTQFCLNQLTLADLKKIRDRGLRDRSLIKRVGEGTYQLHQIVQEFFREKLRQKGDEAIALKKAFGRVIVAQAQILDEIPTLEQIERVRGAIAHLEETANQWLLIFDEAEMIWPFVGIGRFHAGQGNYSLAEPWYRKSYDDLQKLLGNDHPDVASSLNNLAKLYNDQGRYEEAEPLHLQALELWKKLLGNDHPYVATSLNNLALLYGHQGRYEEAEPLYLQALELWKKLLGNDHPDVATSLNNLALLYGHQGRYEEAELLYLQALELRKKLLGNDHPDVATSLNNLAALYDNQGRYEEAELLYLQALELRKKLLGNNHPDVASSLNNLALLYDNQGRYEEAEPLYLQALELWKKLLGNDHPYVASSLNNLALLYGHQGRYEEAELLYLQALELLKKLLGNDHPDVASSYLNLGSLYHQQGQYQKAKSLYLPALEIYQQRLGANHPNTQNLLSWINALPEGIKSVPLEDLGL